MNGKRGVFPFPSRRFISLATEEVLFLKTNRKRKKRRKTRRKNYFLLLFFSFLFLFFSFSFQPTQRLVFSVIMYAVVLRKCEEVG